MDDERLNGMLAKFAAETDLKKRAQSLVADADDYLDEMARTHAAETGLGYYEAYGVVTRAELGARFLETREKAARLVEEQPSIN